MVLSRYLEKNVGEVRPAHFSELMLHTRSYGTSGKAYAVSSLSSLQSKSVPGSAAVLGMHRGR